MVVDSEGGREDNGVVVGMEYSSRDFVDRDAEDGAVVALVSSECNEAVCSDRLGAGLLFPLNFDSNMTFMSSDGVPGPDAAVPGAPFVSRTLCPAVGNRPRILECSLPMGSV